MDGSFECVLVLESNKPIEAICCAGNRFYYSAKPGSLFIYEFQPSGSPTSNAPFERKIIKVIQTFSRNHSIRQLQVVPNYGIIISISNSVLNVHDLNSYTLLHQEQSLTKGVTLFTTDIHQEREQNGSTYHSLHIAAAAKQRIVLLKWTEGQLREWCPTMRIPDEVKVMRFFRHDFLVVGCCRGYLWINTKTSKTSDDCFIGLENHMEPVMTTLADGRLLLARGQRSWILESLAADNGAEYDKRKISWTNTPTAIEAYEPFLLGLNAARVIEVILLTESGTQSLQRVDMTGTDLNCQMLCRGSEDQLYLGSATRVWRLVRAPIQKQIASLLSSKNYLVALNLLRNELGVDVTNSVNTVVAPSRRSERIQQPDLLQQYYELLKMQAMVYFCQRKYDDAFKLFRELGNNVDEFCVIQLFDALHPITGGASGDAPTSARRFRSPLLDHLPPTAAAASDVSDADRERSLKQLIDYLLDRRKPVMTAINELRAVSDRSREQDALLLNHDRRLTVYDTSLLKCYVLCKQDNLLNSFIKTSYRSLDLLESKAFLDRYEKRDEQLVLYEKRGLHDDALALLWNSYPSDRLVDYLKRVPVVEDTVDGQAITLVDVNVVLEYAERALSTSSERALTLFTDENSTLAQLPRQKVFDFLNAKFPQAVLKYLEFVVRTPGETGREFHNLLGRLYIEEVNQALRRRAPVGGAAAKADVATLQRRLATFLKESSLYQPEVLLQLMPLDSLFEERCTLLGRLGDHERALKILLYAVGDLSSALAYCDAVYQTQPSSDIYYRLIEQLFLWQPEQPPQLGIVVPAGASMKRYENRTDIALRIMEEKGTRMDIGRVLALVPSEEVSLDRLANCLQRQMAAVRLTRNQRSVEASLLAVERRRCVERQVALERTMIVVTEDRCCAHCKRRLGKSAFARLPSNAGASLVHLSCLQQVVAN